MNPWERMERLLGADVLERLQGAHVLMVGLGGVGGHCADALARCGVGAFTLVDPDVVQESNLNRQMAALRSTLGLAKAEVIARRILDINPQARVRPLVMRFPGGVDVFEPRPDCVVDAIDDVPGKLRLIVEAKARDLPIVSCMGAGNKLDPTRFEGADIYATSVDPLCRIMRGHLRKAGVESLRVVYSKETPVSLPPGSAGPGSLAYVTASAGLVLAHEAVHALLGNDEKF